MREIKFRAWNEKAGDWYSSSIIKEFGLRFKDKYLLQQFTGLLDKNGVEIYEGDIVCHVEDVVAEVIGGYERREPEGIFTEIKIPDIYIQVGGDLPDADELEVIGNIYENPELLTDSE